MDAAQIITPSDFIGKHVVFVFERMEVGGAERRGLLIARYLHEEHGAFVEVLGLYGDRGPLAQACEEAGVPWRVMKQKPLRTNWDKILLFTSFIWMLKREKIDILMPYTRVPNVICGLTWRFGKVGLCVWNQADEGLGMQAQPVNRLSAALTPVFLTNSVSGKKFLCGTLSVPEECIYIVRNGVNVAPVSITKEEAREHFNIPPGTLVVTMVANLSKKKDHETLLLAWREVIIRFHEQDIILLLSGRLDDAAEIQDLAVEMGVDGTVRFLGYLDCVPLLLAATDLFVYSSRSEGCPNAILEAMEAGVAVVATDISGIRQLVGESYQYLASPGDPFSFAMRMEELLLIDSLRIAAGQYLRSRVAKEFPVIQMLERTTSILAAIMQK